MHTIKQVYKKANRYWQHEDTGYVAIATWKPSSRWYQITKKQYEDYLSAQQTSEPIDSESEPK